MKVKGPAAVLVFLVVAAVTSASGQEPPAPRVVAKENVRLRTVKVVLSDKSGKPLRLAPVAADFEVFEDGVAATLVGIDPVFEHAAARVIPRRLPRGEASRGAEELDRLPYRFFSNHSTRRWLR